MVLKNNFKLLAFILLSLSFHTVFCMFEKIKIDKVMTDPKEISLKAEIVSGSGTVEAPFITIFAHQFRFKGTIICDGTCRIIATKNFDPDQFRRQGTGEYICLVYRKVNLDR